MAGAGVTFFGRVDSDRKQDLVASAHVLVATSVREGWGLVVSEAAQLGTPAVGYDVPGLRDSVPAAGGLLTGSNPSELASVLIDWFTGVAPKAEARRDCGVVPWSTVAREILPHLGGDTRTATGHPMAEGDPANLD